MDYERRLRVALPPAELFAFLCDEQRLPDWRDGLHAVRRLDDAPGAMTRRYAETVETPLGLQTVTVALEADSAAQTLAFAVLDGPVRPRGELVLRAAGTGTELAYRITYRPPLRIATPLDRLIFDALVGNVDRSLERLQRVLAAHDARPG
ncbi:MAG: hypothetical protein NVSMB19_24240 [Vulcanimicrobiaceae bacterium]